MQTYWIEGYKIAARSASQALQALEQLKRYGAKPDYHVPARSFAVCMPNNVIPC